MMIAASALVQRVETIKSAISLLASTCSSLHRRGFSSSPPETSSSSTTSAPVGKHTVLLSDAVSRSWPAQPPQQSLRAKYSPWEITRNLAVKSGYQRRMRFLVQALEEERVQSAQVARPIPHFRSGDILEVRMVVPENQRRQYIYRGVCIARYNKGIRSSFKMYNVYPDGGRVVQHLPLYMPDLLSIEVVGRVNAGSRVKKYHILENESSKYSFQKQVKVVGGAADAKADSEAKPAGATAATNKTKSKK